MSDNKELSTLTTSSQGAIIRDISWAIRRSSHFAGSPMVMTPNERFGKWLRDARIRASLGLRKFAALIGDQPSNVCNLENGKRPIPQNEEKLRKMAEVLGIEENSQDWEVLFNLARRPEQPPADVSRYVNIELVPTLLRTIGEYRLGPEDIQRLLKYVERIGREKNRGNANATKRRG